jgi:hypothetical protein
MNKTLIGKDNYLFLINDTCRELDVHCNNLLLLKDTNLSHLCFKNYMIVIFPNKSLYFKNYLPDEYVVMYRPAFDIYKQKLKNRLLDGYEILKDTNNSFYKTDTHINLRGNYMIYLEFIKKANENFNLDLKSKQIKINVLKDVELQNLGLGIGDLTWPINLGEQKLENIKDNYYYSDDFEFIYMKHKISSNDNIRFLSYDLIDSNDELDSKHASWDIISKYIIYKNNKEQKHKVIIFYDSFLLPIIALYLELFNEIYMIKSVYNNKLINLIKPDYIFEFRVERFLL